MLARFGDGPSAPRKIRALVAAFTVLPRELSADLDAHRIALAPRPRLLLTELAAALDDGPPGPH